MGILSGLLKIKPVSSPKVKVAGEPKSQEPSHKEDLSKFQVQAEEILEKARGESERIKAEAEKARHEALKMSEDLVRKEDFLTQKFNDLQREQDLVRRQKEELAHLKEKVVQSEKEQVERLQKIASLTKTEAQKQLLESLERELKDEMAKRIKEADEEVRLKSDETAKQILIDAMQSAKRDYVAEYTTSRVSLPDEEMKGRIIGRDGRNIKALERATGVDFDLDEFPGEIRISSFDGVRREIAKISLERLIADGRFQPAKIEEIVAQTKADVARLIRQTGEKLSYEAGVTGLPVEIIDLLGRFKYRTSYGQNLIEHTLEIVKLAQTMALELKADVKVAKTAGLLHDIGKVLVEDMEGPHAQLTRQILEKYRFDEKIINAASAHHEEEEFKSLEAVIVHIADAISGARPGARVENYEAYYTRLRELEATAKSFPGINEVYAISAGRELRVVVKPDDIDDASAVKLSHDIAKKIQETQRYPGVVKVTVIRETRASDLAK